MYSGGMSRKPAPKPDDPEQLKRFREMAREVGVDEAEGAFDRAFDRISGKAKSPKPEEGRSRRNDPRAS